VEGICTVISDGYYFVGSWSFILGCVVLIGIVAPGVKYLESLPDSVWLLQKKEDSKEK
jgi:PAT family acetyl-CoA transporter-like MFS transporter 1